MALTEAEQYFRGFCCIYSVALKSHSIYLSYPGDNTEIQNFVCTGNSQSLQEKIHLNMQLFVTGYHLALTVEEANECWSEMLLILLFYPNLYYTTAMTHVNVLYLMGANN